MTANQEKKSLAHLLESIPQRSGAVYCTGLAGTAVAHLVSRLYAARPAPLFLVLPAPRDAERFIDELQFFGGPAAAAVRYFPPYNLMPFKQLAYHNQTTAQRIRTLYGLMTESRAPLVVTTVGAVMQRLIPKREIGAYVELIMAGEEFDRDALVHKLASGGYERTALVEEPGDFCLRGGILDVFSPLYDHPLRLEFFGDTVDSIRLFSARTQRTTRDLAEAVLLPAREAILTESRLDQVINRVRCQASLQQIPVSHVRELVARIRTERVFPGIESLIPLMYARLDTFFDYSGEDGLFVVVAPQALQQAAEKLSDQATRNYLSAREDHSVCVEPEAFYLDWPQLWSGLRARRPLVLTNLPVGRPPDDEPAEHPDWFEFQVQDNDGLQMALKDRRERDNVLEPLIAWIEEQRQLKRTILFACRTSTQAERLKALLAARNIEVLDRDDAGPVLSARGRLLIGCGQIAAGFVWPDDALAVVSGDEIFGRRSRRTGRSGPKLPTELLTFENLKQNDLVVHVEHGIGQYEGLVKLKLNGATNDFLLVVYREGDKLYLPVDRMESVQKYMGVDGISPVLDKMGGKSWDKVRRRVKRSVEKIAGELLKLYAARTVTGGHAFAEAGRDLEDFETGFPYEETVDQQKAIEDVLRDMAAPRPMDRLICGDVGYGKTEVALRASFAAVNGGKQVALLVPTTVLAEQHYATFKTRFERFAVEVACLSRFRPLKEQLRIIEGMKSGRVDIVIGTHRLLQKDVSLKDLGLLILDEEQRFGVKHKEKMKKLRQNVDVLALTATPIPRTLHMSLMGIRDISVISTPPEQRRAIVTYIAEFENAVIQAAIRKELARGGQLYFVHNNINTIYNMARLVKELVPELRLDVAHGRMKENDLERVMRRFLVREIDMLVCTTIIEAGLDIPAANTILVNRADRFGLAQIYQLRGRVGRSDEQAYAYLFIPRNSVLGRDAQKRLKVLMEHSDLGSGFQIAMSDLKIRGGGTILGASQSGHIAAVGYDMFLKLMEEAIAEQKGQTVTAKLDPEINISMSAFIPETYIPDIDQRLATYRRLARVSAVAEISDLKREVIDRFGTLPNEVLNLFLKILLKVLSVGAGVKRLDLSGRQLRLCFSPVHQRQPDGIVELLNARPRTLRLTPDHVLEARLPEGGTVELLGQTKNILKEIGRHVNA